MKLPRRSRSHQSTGRSRRQTPAVYQSPRTLAYHSQRAPRSDQPARQQLTRSPEPRQLLSRQFWLKRSGVIAISIVVIICLVSVLTLSTDPRIVLLTNNHSFTFRNSTAYEAAARKVLASSLLNHNKVTVDTTAVQKSLLKQFPELASVSVTLPLVNHRPVITLSASAPTFVFQAVNGNYVLDANGKALVTQAAAPAGSVSGLLTITDQTGAAVTLGHQAISSDAVAFIQTVAAELNQAGMHISALDLPANAAQELDVHISGQPYYIKFNMHDTSGARQQAGTYLATIHSLTAQHTTPSQYIDVRLDGRAYYL